MKDNLVELRKEFFKRLERGIIMSSKELMAFARRRGLLRLPGITKALVKNVRRFWKEMAAFERYRKPVSFQGIGIFRYGLVFIDWANFFPRLAKFNKGCNGFIIAVENVSGQLHVVPVKNRKRETWQRAIEKIIEESPIAEVKTILSDREGALVSSQFVRKMRDRYGIKMGYLTVRSKAWKAERMIGYVKNYLSKIMKTTRRRQWINLVAPMLRRYNDQVIPKTSFKRRQVNETNFHQFLNQKMGVEDISALHSLATASIQNPKWSAKVFKFNLGDKVLLSRKISSIVLEKNNRSIEPKMRTFIKISEVGNFNPQKPLLIVDRKLKSATGHLLLLPVYKLATLEGDSIKGWFYARDLQLVLEPPPAP